MSNAKIFPVVTFIASLFVAGCSGITIDVSDCAADVPDDITSWSLDRQYAMAKPRYAGSVIVNEAKDSVTLVVKTFGGCEKHGDEFVWNSDFYYGDTATYGYRFSGDTLFLSTRSLVEKGFEDSEEMLVERILIGEGNEGLDGVWLMTSCSYFDGKLRCSDYAYEELLLIDGGDAEWRALDKMNADFMESVFIDELFSYIGSRSSALQLETVFYGTETESTANRYGIDVVAKSNTAMTFTYADREFNVALTYAGYMDSVHVTVSAGGIECVGSHKEHNYNGQGFVENALSGMSGEVCREEYADDLREQSSGVWSYWSQNSDEFARCIDGILGREGE